MDNNNSFSIIGNLINVTDKQIYKVELFVTDQKITSIKKLGPEDSTLPYILPGFIDSHVHIESSMLVPSQFAKLAVVHGTVATVSDPHEIGNVCGMQGVHYMLADGKKVPFNFYFGAPSCIPATTFETAGATINVEEVKQLLELDEIKYLSEMMNYPGVLNKDDQVMQKLQAAINLNKPIDGHAPGVRKQEAQQYINAGISTDHECFTAEEAQEKLDYGMKILIREGSAAKNFEALVDLLNDNEDNMMFCSDDKHPDSLVEGHINQLCARAVAKGVDLFKVLKAACINPVHHYKLDVGLLVENADADFIVVKDLTAFTIDKTFIKGRLVADNGKSLIETETSEVINQFNCSIKKPEDFAIPIKGQQLVMVIEALDGQLITNKISVAVETLEKDNFLQSNIEQDILKIAVINRYHQAPIALGWIKNFGFRHGAIASTVAHDSHNIIVVGVDDDSICRAVNLVIESRGGISCVSRDQEMLLPLPVAGLMSTDDGYKVAEQYTNIDAMAKSLGSPLSAPFMTLSFMALLVIPHIKLSDLGMFDGDCFSFI